MVIVRLQHYFKFQHMHVLCVDKIVHLTQKVLSVFNLAAARMPSTIT